VIDDRRPAHLGDEDFVLDYYGELDAAERERVRVHLASCPGCQRADQDVRAILRLVDVAPAPEPPSDFEREMWARIEPHIRHSAQGGSRGWLRRVVALGSARFAWPRTVWAGGLAAALIVAFIAGRGGRPAPASGPASAPVAAAASRAVTRERLLDAVVEDHFERSQRVLAEVVNGDTTPPVTLASDRARAADLVAAGRVYRRSADTLGDAATSELLEDLERVLLDIANGSPDPTPGELRALRERIDDQDLVFRLRVVGAELRRRQGPATPAY
jgi:hypothetical protein